MEKIEIYIMHSSIWKVEMYFALFLGEFEKSVVYRLPR